MPRLAVLLLLLPLAACDSSEPAEPVVPRFQATAEGSVSGPLTGQAYADGDDRGWMLVVQLDVEPDPIRGDVSGMYRSTFFFDAALRPGTFPIPQRSAITLPITPWTSPADSFVVLTAMGLFEPYEGAVTVERVTAAGVAGRIAFAAASVFTVLDVPPDTVRLEGTFEASRGLPPPVYFPVGR